MFQVGGWDGVVAVDRGRSAAIGFQLSEAEYVRRMTAKTARPERAPLIADWRPEDLFDERSNPAECAQLMRWMPCNDRAALLATGVRWAGARADRHTWLAELRHQLMRQTQSKG